MYEPTCPDPMRIVEVSSSSEAIVDEAGKTYSLSREGQKWAFCEAPGARVADAPVCALRGVAEAAQRTAVKASQKRQLRLIYDCAVRLIDFVTSMMEFSALRQRRADKVSAREETVVYHRLFAYVVEIIQNHMKFRWLTIICGVENPLRLYL